MASPRLIVTIPNSKPYTKAWSFVEVPPTRLSFNVYTSRTVNRNAVRPEGVDLEQSPIPYDSYESQDFEVWSPWLVLGMRHASPSSLHLWFRPRPLKGPRSRLYRCYWPHVWQFPPHPPGIYVTDLSGSYICPPYGSLGGEMGRALEEGEDPLVRAMNILSTFIATPFRHHDWSAVGAETVLPLALRSGDPVIDFTPIELFPRLAALTRMQVCHPSMMLPAEITTMGQVLAIAEGKAILNGRITEPPRSHT